MLDLAAIKSTSRTGDAPSQTGKKPVDRGKKDGPDHEFQSAYDSTSIGSKSTSGEFENSSAPEASSGVASKSRSDQIADTDGEESEASPGEKNAETSSDADGFGTTEVNKDSVGAPNISDAGSSADADKTGRVANADQIDPFAEKTTRFDPTSTAGELNSPVLESNGSKQSLSDSHKQKTVGLGKTTAESIIMSKAVEHAKSDTNPNDSSLLVPESRVNAPLNDSSKQSANGQVGLALSQTEKKQQTEKAREALPRDAEFRADVAKQATPVKTAAMTQNSSLIAKSQTLKIVEIAKDKADSTLLATGDTDLLGPFEARSSTSASGTTFAQTLTRPDTPSMIARQMATALQKLPDRPVEISLNPKELGRVRMNISTAEAGITVNIVAERPETLDLMRRNIEQLAREFQLIGYENIDFAFSEGEGNQGFADENDDSKRGAASYLDLVADDDAQANTEHMMTASGGVDIRL